MNPMTNQDKLQVEIWSDVVCPWCYIGKRRFERGLAAFAHRDEVEVVYRSFQLDPTAVRNEQQTVVEHLARKYGVPTERARAMIAQVEQTAATEGLEFHLADANAGNTFDAHRVLHLAADRGLADPAWERLYRAYFTEGQSLFDHESLVRLATEAGLDPAEVRRVLTDDTYADAIEADRYEAAALGANGVPFFVIDRRYGVSGAQPAEVFAQALARAWADRHPITLVNSVSATAGADGAVCSDESCAVPTAGTPADRAGSVGR